MGSSALGPGARRRALEVAASGELDLLIVGGGITGAGAALDAATRGLRVALIEARDLAAGASSASSKLIHGGLRYLEMGDLGLVREALRERELLLTRLAPHLVAPVPFLWPLRGRAWERGYLAAGLALYDTLGGARSVPRHRHLTRRGALAVAPALRPDGFSGAVQFHDASEDDARMVVAVARTAAAHGAHLATRTRVTAVRPGGAVEAVDAETGRRWSCGRGTSPARRAPGRTACAPSPAGAPPAASFPPRASTCSSRASASPWTPACWPGRRRACSSSSPGTAAG